MRRIAQRFEGEARSHRAVAGPTASAAKPLVPCSEENHRIQRGAEPANILRINTCIRSDGRTNVRSLKSIYEQCRSAGLVESQPQCSAMFNRTGSWLSSMLAREGERRVSTEALLSFYFSLADLRMPTAGQLTAKQIDAIGTLRAELWNEIASRVRR